MIDKYENEIKRLQEVNRLLISQQGVSVQNNEVMEDIRGSNNTEVQDKNVSEHNGMEANTGFTLPPEYSNAFKVVSEHEISPNEG